LAAGTTVARSLADRPIGDLAQPPLSSQALRRTASRGRPPAGAACRAGCPTRPAQCVRDQYPLQGGAASDVASYEHWRATAVQAATAGAYGHPRPQSGAAYDTPPKQMAPLRHSRATRALATLPRPAERARQRDLQLTSVQRLLHGSRYNGFKSQRLQLHANGAAKGGMSSNTLGLNARPGREPPQSGAPTGSSADPLLAVNQLSNAAPDCKPRTSTGHRAATMTGPARGFSALAHAAADASSCNKEHGGPAGEGKRRDDPGVHD